MLYMTNCLLSNFRFYPVLQMATRRRRRKRFPGLVSALIQQLPRRRYRRRHAAADAPAGDGSSPSSPTAGNGVAGQAATSLHAPTPPPCTICLMQIEEGDSLIELPACGHAFHAGCLTCWLKRSATCPVCRCVALPEYLKGQARGIDEEDEKPRAAPPLGSPHDNTDTDGDGEAEAEARAAGLRRQNASLHE